MWTIRSALFWAKTSHLVIQRIQGGQMSMNETVQCIRCHAQMEDGYVPDSTDGGLLQQIWPSGEASAELAGSQRNEERSMCSSHNAPLSEVWILGILCNACDPFRKIAAWQIAAGVNECKRLWL